MLVFVEVSLIVGRELLGGIVRVRLQSRNLDNILGALDSPSSQLGGRPLRFLDASHLAS